MLSIKQVDNLVKLLHEDYQDCKVTVVESKRKALLIEIKENILCWKEVVWKRELRHLKSILNGNLGGNYNSILKTANIYNFSTGLEDKSERMYYTVFVLFHELRHHYQNKHNRLQRHDIEPDCHRFACRMMDKHHVEIMKIIGGE